MPSYIFYNGCSFKHLMASSDHYFDKVGLPVDASTRKAISFVKFTAILQDSKNLSVQMERHGYSILVKGKFPQFEQSRSSDGEDIAVRENL
jgi:hypothetical protein